MAYAAKKGAAVRVSDLSYCSASEPFALRVMGDDMAPEFVDGHIIILDPAGKKVSGCYVVARQGGEMIFRQLVIDREFYLLRALDSSLPELTLANGLQDIVGVVSQRSGKRRSEHKRYDV
ncbi:MAG: S24 family peptidase [Gammaproteobacteria bacterium]|nr:S24 family peptidase [Gammaproteobacteria bacterium]